MNLRELIIEYIMFAYTDAQLQEKFHVSEADLEGLSDIDLLEIYDMTLLLEPV